MSEGQYEQEWMLVAEVMGATRGAVTVWRTKDGREIPVADMTNDHALNALRMVQRRIATLQQVSLAFPPARDGAEEHYPDPTCAPIQVCEFWVRVFRAELTRRGFKFPDAEDEREEAHPR